MFDVLAGFLVGLVVGLTGVGGGALMTPILVLLFGMSPVTAVGTDLWACCCWGRYRASLASSW